MAGDAAGPGPNARRCRQIRGCGARTRPPLYARCHGFQHDGSLSARARAESCYSLTSLRCFVMRIVYFTHSVTSCWNHGNAHFLRGVLRELVFLGHEVRVFEPEDGWSRTNLLQDGGASTVEAFHQLFPELTAGFYGDVPDLDLMLDGADLVIVHEWTAPALVAAIGRKRLHGR